MCTLGRLAVLMGLCALLACGAPSSPQTTARSSGDAAQDDQRPRLALVIGIGNYSGDIPPLRNPVRDAELIARSLQALGFQMPVPVVRNATGEQLRSAMAEFSTALDAAGPNAIGLIYFAGHGMQVDGVNYLLPSDARRPRNLPVDPARVRQVLSQSFMPADDFLVTLGSRPGGASILILDACRDNPLTRSLAQTRSSGGGTPRGLSEMGRATGILIAYATTPGDVSYDGDDAQNSPYASALAEEVLSTGTVYEVFNRVRGRVEDATGGLQSPKETNGLRGSDRFCFGPCAGAPPSAPSVNPAPSGPSAPTDASQLSERLLMGSWRGYWDMTCAQLTSAPLPTATLVQITFEYGGIASAETVTYNDRRPGRWTLQEGKVSLSYGDPPQTWEGRGDPYCISGPMHFADGRESRFTLVRPY